VPSQRGDAGVARQPRCGPQSTHLKITLKRDRGRAADEPDEALKRSLRELIVGDRGLIAFLSRHARR